MVIHNLCNADKLFRFLDSCEGSLQIVLPDGKSYDWDADATKIKGRIRELSAQTLDRLELRAADKNDTNCILNFMLEATIN